METEEKKMLKNYVKHVLPEFDHQTLSYELTGPVRWCRFTGKL
jgi:hypothetical protein